MDISNVKPPLGGLGVKSQQESMGYKPPLGGLGANSRQENRGYKPPLSHQRGIKDLFLKSLFVITFLSALLPPASGQTLDYPEIFGDDWKKAMLFESENRSWMEAILEKNHIPYPVAVAVIFPELVRYSALRDKMEITLLKTLYINLGEDYANFSIGHFQMKPSFAVIVREQANSVLNRRSGIHFSRRSEFDDLKDYRRSIVKDLEDPKTEFSYLVAFLKICEKNFRTNHMEETERIRFLATAYNFGIELSSADIESMTGKKFFNTKLFKTENYSYADVSLYWYKQYKISDNSQNK